jgi:small GTP-binding protein
MYDALFKVCIFGDGGVGKTSLVNRFLTGLFKSGTIMTIGVDFLMKDLEFQGKKVALQIWDFAGEKRFQFLLPGYVKGTSAGIFMFDITRMSSLTSLNEWLEVFKKGADEEGANVPIMIVGGKIDLTDRRSVFSIDAKEMAQSYNLLDYIECSSKTGENIELIFDKLAQFLLKNAGII